MNNSWMTDSNSTGFVYFQIDTTPTKDTTKAETSDYMAFGDHNPSPHISRFTPNSYSSPQNFRRGNPRNFHKRGWKHNYGNRSFSPNTSYNSSYNSRNRSRESNSHSFRSLNDSFNERTYASFLEDPWAKLEKQLEQKRRHESSRLEQNSGSSSSDSSDCDILNKSEEQAT